MEPFSKRFFAKIYLVGNVSEGRRGGREEEWAMKWAKERKKQKNQ